MPSASPPNCSFCPARAVSCLLNCTDAYVERQPGHYPREREEDDDNYQSTMIASVNECYYRLYRRPLLPYCIRMCPGVRVLHNRTAYATAKCNYQHNQDGDLCTRMLVLICLLSAYRKADGQQNSERECQVVVARCPASAVHRCKFYFFANNSH